jgi:Protein of unknown function (DUF3631)
MNWRILLAIAERCCAKKAAWSAVKVVEEVSATVDPELAAQILSDVRDAFDKSKTDKLTTKALLAELTGNEEGPWLSFGKAGKPLNDRQLGRLLKDFRRGKGIKSKTIRIGQNPNDTARGYERADFEEDFAAYLPTKSSSEGAKTLLSTDTTTQLNNFNGLEEKTCDTRPSDVSDKTLPNPLKTSDCVVVSDKNPDLAPSEAKTVDDRDEPPLGRCAQCNGLAADAPLVEGGGYPPSGVHLHEQCRRFWLKGHRVGRDRFRKVGDCAPGTHCALCHSPGEVALWRDTHIVGRSAVQLHEACAPKWWRDA